MLAGLDPQIGKEAGPCRHSGRHGEGLPGDDTAVGQPDPGNVIVGDHHGGDLAVDDADVPRRQPRRGRVVQGRSPPEVDDVIAELAEQQGLVHRRGPARQHANGLVPHLPAVAVRAVDHVPSPPLAQPGDVGQVVDEPAGHQQPPGLDHAPVSQGDREPRVKPPADGDDLTGHHVPAVRAHLGSSPPEQLGGRAPVVPEQPVHRRRRPVARLPRVNHKHRPPRPH
jgi:hypothetical protein